VVSTNLSAWTGAAIEPLACGARKPVTERLTILHISRRLVSPLSVADFTRSELETLAAATPAGVPVSSAARLRVGGKFLFIGDEKLYVRGTTYGAFCPDAAGNEYHDRESVDRDFA
jgi:hypothetical protein